MEDLPSWTTEEKMVAALRQWRTREPREDSFRVERDSERGLCVIAQRAFEPWDFIGEYEGEFITRTERLRRELEYQLDDPGSFIVDAWWNGARVAIDATRTIGTWGRLFNHARDPNVRPYPHLLRVDAGEPPRMAFYCHEAIRAGEEVMWDYGLKDDEAPWATFLRSTAPSNNR